MIRLSNIQNTMMNHRQTNQSSSSLSSWNPDQVNPNLGVVNDLCDDVTFVYKQCAEEYKGGSPAPHRFMEPNRVDDSHDDDLHHYGSDPRDKYSPSPWSSNNIHRDERTVDAILQVEASNLLDDAFLDELLDDSHDSTFTNPGSTDGLFFEQAAASSAQNIDVTSNQDSGSMTENERAVRENHLAYMNSIIRQGVVADPRTTSNQDVFSSNDDDEMQTDHHRMGHQAASGEPLCPPLQSSPTTNITTSSGNLTVKKPFPAPSSSDSQSQQVQQKQVQRGDLNDDTDIIIGRYSTKQFGKKTAATDEFWDRFQKKLRPEYHDPGSTKERKLEIIEKMMLLEGGNEFFSSKNNGAVLFRQSKCEARKVILKRLRDKRGIDKRDVAPDPSTGGLRNVDVICGRGEQSGSEFHPGTKYYWTLSLQYRKEYLALPNKRQYDIVRQKRLVAQSVTKAIFTKDGRFVYFLKSGVIMSLKPKEAETKVMIAFRDEHEPEWSRNGRVPSRAV
jgi:hypothetical protein